MAITGSCLCGAVSYEITGSFKFMGNCHCSMCRKSHGAAFATWGIIDPDQFRWTSGKEFVQAMNPLPEDSGAFARSAGLRLSVPITEPSARWLWEHSTVIRLCDRVNTFSWDPKRPGTR